MNWSRHLNGEKVAKALFDWMKNTWNWYRTLPVEIQAVGLVGVFAFGLKAGALIILSSDRRMRPSKDERGLPGVLSHDLACP